MATAPKHTGSGVGDAAVVVCGVVIALAAASVALRFYTRIFTRLGLWWDDWLILAAMLATSTCAALVLAGTGIDPNGDWVTTYTEPGYIFTPEDTVYMKVSYAASTLYFTVAGTTKLGILLMYTRIFSISDGFRTQVIVTSSVVLAYWIGCTVATLLTCRPMSFIWSSVSGYPTNCFNYNVFWMAAGACELLLDIIILALPIRAVMKIKLSPRQRNSTIGIFLLGGFIVVTGFVKVILAYNPGGHVPLYGAADVWVTLHAGMAIVCACLPILKPLVTRWTGSAFSTRGSISSRDRHGTGESDGWNIIHLDVEDGNSDCGSSSLKSASRSHTETNIISLR